MGHTKGIIHLFALLLIATSVILIAFFLKDVRKQSGGAEAFNSVPANDKAKGLVYDDLEADKGSCPQGFKVKGTSRKDGKSLCTHGPDTVPQGFDITQTVALAQNTSSGTKPGPAGTSFVCDGDGTSGNRTQVLYVHAADVPDQFSTVLPSILGWAAGADSNFQTSASQTGGNRHIRFVQDPTTCTPTVQNVTVSATGDDTFGATINEISAQGFNRSDRDYMIFEDAHVYCGISSVGGDDFPGPGNISNTGGQYGRIDAGCWSAVVSSHELMHNLGSVNFSAPHADGTFHCKDGYDNMCDHSGTGLTTFTSCPDPAMDSLFDCNHDDYFNTNPPAGNYLTNHWNTAFNSFLIGSEYTKVDYVKTLIGKGGNALQASNFPKGATVYIQMHAINQLNTNVSGANINFSVKDPTGKEVCKLTASTRQDGTASSSCAIPQAGPAGVWDIHLNGVTFTSGKTTTPSYLIPWSVMDTNFNVN